MLKSSCLAQVVVIKLSHCKYDKVDGANSTMFVKSSTSKTKLIPGSQGISNSAVVETILLGTQQEHVRRICNFLTVHGGNLSVNCNHHLIINYKFMQDTMWVGIKFIVIIANCYLSRVLIMYNMQMQCIRLIRYNS